MRAIALLAAGLAVACSITTTAPVTKVETFKTMNELMVAPPDGFGKAEDVALRDRHTIFEQINGGSVSFLDNGMQEAIFGTYLNPKDEAAVLDLEVYRFTEEAGPLRQYKGLHGSEPIPWEGGAGGLVHEYGVELVAERLLVRVVYNDGPAEAMAKAAHQLARDVVRRITGQ